MNHWMKQACPSDFCDTAVKPVWRQLVQLPFLLLARGFRDKGVAKEHLCVSMRQHASACVSIRDIAL